jgi:hypothetical protein
VDHQGIKIAIPAANDPASVPRDVEYLMTATINGLYVYAIHNRDAKSTRGMSGDMEFEDEKTAGIDEPMPFLSLVNMFPISGRVASIHALPEAHSRGDDRIIVTLDEGKFAVVRFSPRLADLIIEDMYNAEEGAIGLGSEVRADAKGRLPSPGRFGSQPLTVVDCDHRIVCSLLYDDQLFVLPPDEGPKRSLKTHTRSHNTNVASRTGTGGNLSAAQPFIIDFSKYISFPDIIDISFLPGYGSPTLAVLHRLERVPIGHEKEHRNLVSLAVFTLDFRLKSLSLLWKFDGLPNDSLQILPIKATGLIGGVFLVTMNACIIVKYDLVAGLATNGLAAVTVSPNIPLRPFNDISRKAAELDGSRWICPSDDTFVCALNDGRLMCVSIGFVNSSNISDPKNIYVQMLAESVACATFTTSFDKSLWFLGAVASDSLLVSAVHMKDVKFVDLSVASINNKAAAFSTPLPKKRKVSSISTPASSAKSGSFGSLRSPIASMNLEELREEQEKEEIEMYGVALKYCALVERLATISSFSLRVVDSVASLGAVTDGTLVAADESYPYSLQVDWDASMSRGHKKLLSQNALIPATAYVQERECRDSFQISAGVDKDGSLNRVFSGFRMSKLASVEFADAVLIDSMVYRKMISSDVHVTSTLIFVTTISGVTRFFESTAMFDHSNKVGSILEGSVTERTSVETGFVANFPTLFVGTILNGRYGIQVFSIGLRLTSLTSSPPSPLQDLLIEEDRDIGGLGGVAGEYIVAGDILSDGDIGFVSILSSNGTVYVLKFDEDDQNMIIVTSSDSDPSENCSFSLGSKGTYASVSLFHGSLNFEAYDFFEQPDPMGSPGPNSKHSRGGDTPISTSRLLRSHSLQSDISTNNETVSTPSKGRLSSTGNGKDELRSADNRAIEEEIFLYGKRLHANADLDDFPVPQEHDVKTERIQDAYLLLCDTIGLLHIVRLADFKLMFVTSPLGVGAKNINIYTGERYLEIRNHFAQICDRVYKVVDFKVASLGSSKPSEAATCAPRRLTIVALLDTADVVVFAANSFDGSVSSSTSNAIKRFIKVHSAVITRRRKTRIRLKRASAASNAAIKNILMSQSATLSPLDSCLAYGIKRAAQIDGRSGFVCYGLRPVFVFNDAGLPSVLPLTFPELPYATLGYNIVAPVVLANGAVSGLLTLFVEVKNQSSEAFVPPPPPLSAASSPQPPPPSGPKPTMCSGVLGMYREIVSLTSFPGSSVTMKRTMTGRTIHEVMEILPLTDDKSQLDLLKKRTFFMSTSVEVERPFIPNVLTEEEEEEDSTNYGRFFPSLKSFGQSSDPLAPPPTIKDRQYSVVLVQNNIITEEFKMKANESILGIEVLYFNIPDTSVPPSLKKTKRHIFLAASTSVDDLHGDDSQSEGRLLLFSLDYAVYDEKNSDSADGTVNFLDTIQPKLKLMWTDHGPSTVVKQLGSQYVIATVGPTIFVYSFSSIFSTLEKISFYFAPVRGGAT